jgi:hypothetical protein
VTRPPRRCARRPSYDDAGIRAAAAAAGVNLSEFEAAGVPTDRLVIQATGLNQERKRKQEN